MSNELDHSYELVPKEFRVHTSSMANNTGNWNNKDSREKLINDIKTHIFNGNIDTSMNLVIKLICNNGYLPFWDTIFDIISENLMVVLNPTLSGWILTKYTILNSLRNKYHSQLYNVQEARNNIAQIVSVICLCEKNKVSIPNAPFMNINININININTNTNINIRDPDSLNINNKDTHDLHTKKHTKEDKSTVLAQEYYMLSQAHGSVEDKNTFFDALSHFIYHVMKDETKHTLYWIYKILGLINLEINTPSFFQKTNTFKYKDKISRHPIWMIWNFILIRVIDPMGIKVKINEIFDHLIFIFSLVVSRKNHEAGAIIIFSSLLLLKYQNQVKWDSKLPIGHHKVIRTVSNVNFYEWKE